MPTINTGYTVNEVVIFLDDNNNPIITTGFTTSMYYNGLLDLDTNINFNLADITKGLYYYSWSAASYGMYQLYVQCPVNNIIYISDAYIVSPLSASTPNVDVYVGF